MDLASHDFWENVHRLLEASQPDDAAAMLREAISEHTEDDLADRARLLLGYIYIQGLHRVNDGIREYYLVGDRLGSPYAPLALLELVGHLVDCQRTADAILAARKLLLRFGHSLEASLCLDTLCDALGGAWTDRHTVESLAQLIDLVPRMHSSLDPLSRVVALAIQAAERDTNGATETAVELLAEALELAVRERLSSAARDIQECLDHLRASARAPVQGR
ncbi:MAG: hypothetical protein HY815_18300 [Candidatus Riflebacteria bacterium]|nr:hypothetical protein [Candidatus Riflebacteria bacterium]